ncbi:MAG: hypothetical protein CBC13_02435 [Planctomycetia bacterium TMED53]|nr:MAG: hypothetical protein CBC13_02435 [Planctomycetia bacterium TMED53]
MTGLILIATISALLEDPLLPERWREMALGFSRDKVVGSTEGTKADPQQESLRLLGEMIFHSNEISGEGERSCATCHDPDKAFQDRQSHPRGAQGIARDTPSLWGVGEQRWFGWDGRWDSLWAQALEPIEAKQEMDSDRLLLLRWIAADSERKKLYESNFGKFPDMAGVPERARKGEDWNPEFLRLPQKKQQELNRAFSNAGRAVEAFERRLVPPRSAFDEYLEALASGDAEKAAQYPVDARRGLIIFLDQGRCVFCHNGPLFSDGEFHDTGLISAGSSARDSGRYGGIMELRANPFNLLGDYSEDSQSTAADRTRRLKRDSRMWGAFRTPGLRGVSQTAPYFHDGSRIDLGEVVRFYSRRQNARPVHQGAGHHGERLVEPLGLTPTEESLLEQFLKTL